MREPISHITLKRLPATLTPFSKSIQPFCSANSQCSFGVKPNSRGVSTFLISTLSSSSSPSGTSSSGIFGIAIAIASSSSCLMRCTSIASATLSLLASTRALSSEISLPSRLYTPNSLLIAFCAAWSASYSFFAALSSSFLRRSCSKSASSTPFRSNFLLTSSKSFWSSFRSIIVILLSFVLQFRTG